MKWILIRGLARQKDHWRFFPEMLATQLKTDVHCLDLPGVGSERHRLAPLSISSYSDDLHQRFQIMREENTRCGLIAVSLGGMIGLDWFSRYPDDFEHLVTINTSAGNLSLPTERLSLDAIKMIGKLFLKNDVRLRERSILELTTNMTSITDELVDTWVALDQKHPLTRGTFLRQIMAATTFKVPKALKRNPLILVGEKDQLTNPLCSKKLATHLGCSYLSHSEAGHDLALDDPKWIVTQIENYLVKTH